MAFYMSTTPTPKIGGRASNKLELRRYQSGAAARYVRALKMRGATSIKCIRKRGKL